MEQQRASVREVTVPVRVLAGTDTGGPCQVHVELRLTRADALTLRSIRDAVSGMRLANGRYIQTTADTVRHLIEQVGLAAAKPEVASEPKAAPRKATATKKPRAPRQSAVEGASR